MWPVCAGKSEGAGDKLVDVHPDGRAINLNNGIIRARYRDSLEHTSDQPRPDLQVRHQDLADQQRVSCRPQDPIGDIEQQPSPL
jgi:predicted acyl esterase